jgi:serine O-acetyltransferase
MLMNACVKGLLVLISAFVLFWIVVAIFFRKEIRAAFERDPAASSFLEVLLTYAGLHAIIVYRISHLLWTLKAPFFPRLISQIGRFFTGIEIHPGAQIGEGLFIDHGMGVVIGETTIIGNNVTLFQGVTLGGTGKEKGKRHPTLGNNIVVGTGAKILGNITVGDNVNIGANAVVIRDVPPNSTVVGVPGRISRQEGRRFPGINLDHTNLPDPLTQALDRLQSEIDHIEHEIKEWHEEEKDKRNKKE